jgi:hypothetical protein
MTEGGVMTAPVRTVTRSELEHRRKEILAELGLTLEQFHDVAETRSLTSEEWDGREELDEIAFLLGERHS